jgi:hypothetical protein
MPPTVEPMLREMTFELVDDVNSNAKWIQARLGRDGLRAFIKTFDQASTHEHGSPAYLGELAEALKLELRCLRRLRIEPKRELRESYRPILTMDLSVD